MRTTTIPPGARLVRTYKELENYLRDIVLGFAMFLWIIGRPGVAKSESIRVAVRGRRVYYQNAGQLTAAQFYIDCYHHRGEPIILDDAEHLLENKIGRKLISALGDTNPTKRLCYGTTSRVLGDVPPMYLTTSPLCIIANRATQHEDIRSRAITLYFDPTNLEVHRAVAGWFWDQEIHDWFGQHLHRLPPLDARWYVHAADDKRAGRNWRQIILDTLIPDKATCVIQDLENDPAYPTRKDKARHFTEVMANTKGASRASYFRLRKHLEGAGLLTVETVAPIRLRHTKPPSVPSLLELDAMEAAVAADAEEEPHPVDVPAREAFAQPMRGDVPAPSAHPQARLDDSVSWETPTPQDDEDGEDAA